MTRQAERHRFAVVVAGVTVGVAVVVFVTAEWPNARNKSIIETLDNPRPVAARAGSLLILDDGSQISLPGIVEIRERTPLLDAACARGIELVDGRPIGLISIHHWCGNDPVARHIARVDLADLVRFAGEGSDSAGTLSEAHEDQLTKWGWNVSDYVGFRDWKRHNTN